ncbi:MAG: GH1 family beta-glucosidase [Janthinobacterium lividum]
MTFPENFAWGVATAAYQIEGAAYKAGGGQSVWDMFCRRPGKVFSGENGDVACDHYSRWREDVALMKELGVKAYRLSISWPRILPTGTGTVNAEGLDFYDALIDALLAAGITPYVTLYHWDMPYDLYCRGGWLNRDSADWFADYTQIVADRLSDRVAHWMTLNEPQCFIGLGHESGLHAPGDKLGTAEVLRAGHHALLAHGRSVQAIRAAAPHPVQIGYAPVGVVSVPATDSAADIEAARQTMFDEDKTGLWNNTWWLDPIFRGAYPAGSLKAYGADAPPIQSGDMEIISQPLNFFGCNIYNGQTVRAGIDGQPEPVPHPMGIGRTSYGWPVTPDCLYWGPKFYWERYHQPIIVTENGLGNNDWVALDGQVHDPQRIDFLARHLQQFARAYEDGVDVRGYFQWSLMDNFEWHEGYKMRFGLVYVDYQTQQRISKDSAYWYRDVIQSNGASLG